MSLLPLVGCCIVVRRPLLLLLVACCHAIANALIAGGFHRLCRSSCWLVLALSSAARSRHRPPMWDIQFPHPRAAPRCSHHQPPPACAIPVDGWLLRRRLPPILIVLTLRRRAAPIRSHCQPPPTCAPIDGGCCIVVCHPISLSYPCFCRRTLLRIVGTYVACRFRCQSSNAALRRSLCQPQPAFDSPDDGCCVLR